MCRGSESSLVQQYIPQQKIVTKTDVGILEGYVTLSCFMLGDRPSAIYARFSEEKLQEMKHTGYRCSMKGKEKDSRFLRKLLIQAGQSLSFVNFFMMTVDKFSP